MGVAVVVGLHSGFIQARGHSTGAARAAGLDAPPCFGVTALPVVCLTLLSLPTFLGCATAPLSRHPVTTCLHNNIYAAFVCVPGRLPKMLSMMAWGAARLLMCARGPTPVLLAGGTSWTAGGGGDGVGAPRHWDGLALLCAEHAGDMTPQGLSNCVWALAAVGSRGHSSRRRGGGGGIGDEDDSLAVIKAIEVLLKRVGVMLDRFNEKVREVSGGAVCPSGWKKMARLSHTV